MARLLVRADPRSASIQVPILHQRRKQRVPQLKRGVGFLANLIGKELAWAKHGSQPRPIFNSGFR